MNTNSIYNSRDLKYKRPFGAVTCGTSVTLTLTPDAEDNFQKCVLRIHHEFSSRDEEIVLSGSKGFFTGTYTTPDVPELLWYTFFFIKEDGSTVYFGKNGFGAQHSRVAWQLTVYHRMAFDPNWFGRGITYQIFPDRFCRSTIPDPTDMVGNRWVHKDWDDEPVFLPDSEGIVRNNDYFGGNLAGITSKLDYLKDLHVSTIYLNPIFTAGSNHRYDTSDYREVDPMVGNEEDFKKLCTEAEKRGIRVILDGVFNHTGSNSRYFNKNGFFDEPGAYQSKSSRYYKWFNFHHWPNKYDSWWGIDTLPAVNESNEEYRNFIINDEDSVIRHWLRLGASGWRLDVADELPDSFIVEIRSAMDKEKPDSFLLGEVWEDASNKVAYSQRRQYFLGKELNGTMNYPLRTAILNLLLNRDAAGFIETMESIRENYPREAFYSALNILGTHDTPRILTVLGTSSTPDTKDARAAYRLSSSEMELGIKRLTMAAMILYCFPGSPTLYYGDEAGIEGFEDPFCRRTFPWGDENKNLQHLFKTLGKLRSEKVSLQEGDIEYVDAPSGVLIFKRFYGGETTTVVVNSNDYPVDMYLDISHSLVRDAISMQAFAPVKGKIHFSLLPYDGMVLI